MATIPATWHFIYEAESLRRSSQTISVVDKRAYIFGGELRPREPRDNDVYTLSGDGEPSLSIQSSTAHCPSPRVGHAATTLLGKIYVFSGRGGIAMAPIDEKGSLWEFDPGSSKWTLLSPSDVQSVTYPQARSYHCMANDGRNTIFLHAGCPETGRLSDLWKFDLSSRRWKKLPSAPDPPRGGPSIAFLGDALYRVNGFDGITEQGGNLDIFYPHTNTWSSVAYTPDGESGPVPRSVSALLPAKISGRAHLVTLFGERDPSSLGHQGAGKMLGDIWAFDIESKTWNRVDVQGDRHPAARGWFAADAFTEDKFLVQGGLGESNERLGDVWLLSF